MRRLARHLFTTGAALSLTLAIAVGVFWFRAHSRVDSGRASYVRTPQPHDWHLLLLDVYSFSGTLRFELERRDYRPGYFRGRGDWIDVLRRNFRVGFGWEREPRWMTWQRPLVPPAGFAARYYVDADQPEYSARRWVLGVPHWFVLSLLLLAPAAWIDRFRKRRRAARLGLCRSCGYDLRASPDRCPECGTAGPAHARVSPGLAAEGGPHPSLLRPRCRVDAEHVHP
jgi:hypothetical protein